MADLGTEYDSPASWMSKLNDALRIFTPPPKITATEWADEYFYLSPESSAEAGKYHSSRTPYARGILDELTNPDTHEIVIRAPRQTVKTTVILIGIGMSMDVDRCPMLLVEPTLDLAERVSKRRIFPMLRDCPVLTDVIGAPRTRDANNTLLNKTFTGGALTLAGANSPAGLISEPRKKLFFDEIDYYPPTVGQQGDPIATAVEGAITFWDWLAVYVSRPSVKKRSRIDSLFDESDQRYFHVPCHACHKKQKLEFAQVKWTNHDPNTAAYFCLHCNEPWTDAQRVNNMMNGEWIAERSFEGRAGYTLNGLYHPWRPIKTFIKNFLDANDKKKQGNLQPLRDWENDEMGQSWVDDAERTNPEPLLERRENYSSENIPWQILYLTVGADVQDDRIEVEVIGWRATKRDEPEESWGIEDRVFYRSKKSQAGEDQDEDPDDTEPTTRLGPDWNELDQLLKKEYRTQDGRALRISAAGIDSAGHRTDEVYRFCNARIARHVYATIGRDGPRPIWPRRAGKSKKYKGSLVWTVGVDSAKEAIYSSLRVAAHGPGYSHFPVSYELDFFTQLTSEEVRTRYKNGKQIRYWFKPAGVRNEALDRRAYALAALRSRPVPWEILARSAPTEPPEPPPDGNTPPSKPMASQNPVQKPLARPVGRGIRIRIGGR